MQELLTAVPAHIYDQQLTYIEQQLRKEFDEKVKEAFQFEIFMRKCIDLNCRIDFLTELRNDFTATA